MSVWRHIGVLSLAFVFLFLASCTSFRRPPVVVFVRDRVPGMFSQDVYGQVIEREEPPEEEDSLYLIVRGRF